MKREHDRGERRDGIETAVEIDLRLLALREHILDGLVETELSPLIGTCFGRVLNCYTDRMGGRGDAFYGWNKVWLAPGDDNRALWVDQRLARTLPISGLRRAMGGTWPEEKHLYLYQRGDALILETGDGDLELNQSGWRLSPADEAKASKISEVVKASAVIDAVGLLMVNCQLDASGLARVGEMIEQQEISRIKLRERIQNVVITRARNLVRQVEDNKSSLGEYKFIRGSGAWQLVMAGTASGSVVRAWREFHQSVGSELDRPVTEDRFEGERVVIGEGHKRDPNIAMTIDKSDELLVVSFLPEGKGILVLTSNRQQFFGLDSSPLLEKALGLIDASRRFVGETIGGLAVSE